jgi:digeranylgeranylglycerophospholipid reductase
MIQQTPPDTFDVAVIGAGPSGVMAAWKAAEKGAKTILIEREVNPGRKVCAEGVLAEALPDAEIAPSSDFIANTISGAFLYSPDETKRVNVKGDGYILDKPAFLLILSKRAERTGAYLSYGTIINAIGRDNGHVLLAGERDSKSWSVRSRVVIGCDGVGSILARKFFVRKNYSAIAALQYSMIGCELEDERKLEIYVGHEKAPSGYVWVFPKGKGEANVGIGLKGPNARQLLEHFIASHPRMFSHAKVERSLAAPVPVGGELDEYVADNMMLCGDAAGQVIPLTGAGIHTSLVAGKIAGEVAGESVKSGDCSVSQLRKYQQRFKSLYGEHISNSLKSLESFERFSDEELNIITDYLEGQDLVDMAHGLSPRKAISLMIHHPALAIKVAYQLLRD